MTEHHPQHMEADEPPAGHGGGAVHWPSLSAEEAAEEWPALRAWVWAWSHRFPNCTRLPTCWWRHSDFVEALSALRDYERASFAPNAGATSAVDWLRAMRETEVQLETWIRRLPCSVPGRDHQPPLTHDVEPEGWADFVADDIANRQRVETDRSPNIT